ncbi:aspartate 4-decarboxylase [Solitalea canadensis]|uniref:Aspartate 4-decarboxylase n=1 Tax=Solitalea canadensis (strain ATCC 29591 / DSM 3403 / JCM 21819 / LMG 8368 / NBRC 15130 / NCIMB 12057 / USAM 9D) TaxID=929556 RepID=H8KW80_SOLCM|nr:aspartate 4-decarboxylase [Solitalea canadensis]AFD07101.1 aspartate 4-decarboxylase [Solitalea canadensis DSM 3403]
MSSKIEKIKTSRAKQEVLQQLSPFELKDNLIALASAKDKKETDVMLNAGRGNPNWIATTPREAFFALGQFGLAECRRAMDFPGLAGIPELKGIAKRLEEFIKNNKNTQGIGLLEATYQYGLKNHQFDPDSWVHEMAGSIIGDQYPVPDRMLDHFEPIVHDYIVQEMCDNKPPKGKYDIFAVEGGTAAMCYIFDSLQNNGLLNKGDTIALMVPAFTPYLEIPELERFSFNVIKIEADEMSADNRHTWQYSNEQIEKLSDRSIKALFVTNPSNPPSVAISQDSIKRLIKIVKNMNPNLMIITDDVYGTFVPGFRSLMAELPENTIGVYSFSKYFGCTGWRLGVVVIHENNVFDKMLSALPQKRMDELNRRYSTLTLHPERIKFIDRMVADSRLVALNHTAGLSLPQQTQMMLFSASCLLDKENKYKQLTRDIVLKRLNLLWDNLGIPLFKNPDRAGYYSEIDLLGWAQMKYGDGLGDYLQKNFEPTDILFRLAEKSSIVLLNGGGFDGPEWSIRVSLANLNDDDYVKIGKSLAEIFDTYAEAWKAEKKK